MDHNCTLQDEECQANSMKTKMFNGFLMKVPINNSIKTEYFVYSTGFSIEQF